MAPRLAESRRTLWRARRRREGSRVAGFPHRLQQQLESRNDQVGRREVVANNCHHQGSTLSLGQSHGGKFPGHWCAATEAKWRRVGAASEARRPREPVAEPGAWRERQGGEAGAGGGKRQGGEGGGEEVVAWACSTSKAQQLHRRPATIRGDI